MPLVPAVLEGQLLTIFLDITSLDPTAKANDITGAVDSHAKTGTPQTLHTGLMAPGQAVAGFVTVSPASVSGTGMGGVDSSAPGMTLSAAKAILQAQLLSVFSNLQNTAPSAAADIAAAVTDFFKSPIVMTTVAGLAAPGGPVPAPAGPVGPHTYVVSSETGGLDSSSPGPGLSVSLPIYLTNLLASLLPPGMPASAADAAQLWADLIFDYYSAAIATLTGGGSAAGGPAAVSPESGSGSTLPPGSPIVTGTGTGVLS